jgi:intracellular septation protein
MLASLLPAFEQDHAMQDFPRAAKFLLLDLASTICFLAVFLLTHNTVVSAAVGVSLGVIQIAIQLVRRKPVHMMEWLSLLLIVATGTAVILTDDPRFVLFKPSAVYVVVGLAMLKAGWMLRYLPAIPRAAAPDIITAVGYTWAALMFVTAAVNVLVAVTCSVPTWAIVMLIFGIVSKAIVFIAGFLAIRLTTVRRVHAMPAARRDALMASSAVHGRTLAGGLA